MDGYGFLDFGGETASQINLDGDGLKCSQD